MALAAYVQKMRYDVASGLPEFLLLMRDALDSCAQAARSAPPVPLYVLDAHERRLIVMRALGSTSTQCDARDAQETKTRL